MSEDEPSWEVIGNHGLRRLAWVVEEIENCTAGPLTPSRVTEANFQAFVVCSAWVRLGLAYARGALAVLADGLPEAAEPLERSLWELWIEMVYLLDHGTPADNAARVQITAAMDLVDFLRRTKSPSAAAVAGANRQLRRLKADHPTAYSAIAAQRSARPAKWHWSGLSRSALWRKVMGPDGAELYGLMSWEVHGAVTALRDVRADPKTGQLVFAPRDVPPPEIAVEGAAEHTAQRVIEFWNRYADAFGLPTVDPGDDAPPS